MGGEVLLPVVSNLGVVTRVGPCGEEGGISFSGSALTSSLGRCMDLDAGITCIDVRIDGGTLVGSDEDGSSTIVGLTAVIGDVAVVFTVRSRGGEINNGATLLRKDCLKVSKLLVASGCALSCMNPVSKAMVYWAPPTFR